MSSTPRGRLRVVVGYAHTPAGTAALRWAVAEGQRTGQEVEVIHVFDLRRRADAALTKDQDGVRTEARQQAQQRVHQALADVPAEARVSFTARVGDIEDVLVASAQHATRLVLGQPGNRWDRSRPMRISQRCSTPVTVVSEAGDQCELTGGVAHERLSS